MDDEYRIAPNLEEAMIAFANEYKVASTSTRLVAARVWISRWWFQADNIVHGEVHRVPQTDWQSHHAFGIMCLPNEVSGVDIRPLKRLVRAINSLYMPGPYFGMRPSQEKMFEISSEARESYYELGKACEDTSAIDPWSAGRSKSEWLELKHMTTDQWNAMRNKNAERIQHVQGNKRQWQLRKSLCIERGFHCSEFTEK